MQTYIGDIIDGIRRDTQNADDIPSSTNLVGIETKDFLRYANYAQQRLQSKIARVSHEVFEQTITISLVSGTAAYSINDNVFLGTRIRSVRYSRTGNTVDFIRLPPMNPYDTTSASGSPSSYYRRNGQIILQPVPSDSVGTLEVTYERTLDRLALRRGQVNGTPSGTTIDLTHGTFGAPSTADEALFIKNAYFCIVDAFGTAMLQNGLISSYNAATDAITTAATVDTYLVTGYTLANLADGYFVLGKYATTHSALDDNCERYITTYVNKRIFGRELSDKQIDEDTELREILDDILSSYVMPDKDVKEAPILDYTWFATGYGWDD